MHTIETTGRGLALFLADRRHDFTRIRGDVPLVETFIAKGLLPDYPKMTLHERSIAAFGMAEGRRLPTAFRVEALGVEGVNLLIAAPGQTETWRPPHGAALVLRIVGGATLANGKRVIASRLLTIVPNADQPKGKGAAESAVMMYGEKPVWVNGTLLERLGALIRDGVLSGGIDG